MLVLVTEGFPDVYGICQGPLPNQKGIDFPSNSDYCSRSLTTEFCGFPARLVVRENSCIRSLIALGISTPRRTPWSLNEIDKARVNLIHVSKNHLSAAF